MTTTNLHPSKKYASCGATQAVRVRHGQVRVGKKVHDDVAKVTARSTPSTRLARRLTKFPQLKVSLTDYKVRILDGVAGTAAKTRVLIQSTDSKREWGTVGVSENIITASLQALVDSMEFALLRK
jgi:2-isopropylmalate synthase